MGLLPRVGAVGEIVRVDVPMVYVSHPLNAFDTPEGTMVLDVCFYECMMWEHVQGPFGDSLTNRFLPKCW